MQELINQVIKWGEDRGIFEHSNPTKQLMGAASELGEIFGAFAKEDMEAAKFEIGDFMVTLILFAKMEQRVFSIPQINSKINSYNELGNILNYFSLLFLHYNIKSYLVQDFLNSTTTEIVKVCNFAGFNPEECLQLAYTKISR